MTTRPIVKIKSSVVAKNRSPISFSRALLDKLNEELEVNANAGDLYSLVQKYCDLWTEPTGYAEFIRLHPLKSKKVPVLHWAIEHNHEGLAKQLLEKVTDIDHFSQKGYPPALHYGAMFCANPKMMRMVIEKGADVNFKDLDEMTPLDYLLVTDREKTDDIVEVAQLLLENGTLVNNSRLPVISAVKTENIGLVSILIKHGADLTVKDEDGKGALHHAANADKNKLKMIKLLLEHEKVVEMINSLDMCHQSALDHLIGCEISRDRIEGVKLLRLKGANGPNRPLMK